MGVMVVRPLGSRMDNEPPTWVPCRAAMGGAMLPPSGCQALRQGEPTPASAGGWLLPPSTPLPPCPAAWEVKGLQRLLGLWSIHPGGPDLAQDQP